jgi:hypothetical protein
MSGVWASVDKSNPGAKITIDSINFEVGAHVKKMT